MKRMIDVDENLICEGFVRNFTEEEKDVLINAIRNSIPYEERPQGEWIKNLDSCNDEMQASCYCSECGASCYCATDKFCHECGADMRGGAE